MKRITLLLLAMLLFTACGRNRPADTSSRLIVPTKNALPISGTFLDEISHDIPHQNWGEKEWDRDFRYMKDIGINTVILIRCGYRKFITYPSEYLLSRGCYMPSVDLVDMYLRLAEKYGMKFYFGLYDSGEYWDTGDMTSEIEANRHVIDEVWKMYGEKYSSFGAGMSSIFLLVFFLLYIFFCAISISAVIFVLLAEMYPTKVRGLAMSIAGLSLWVGTYLIGQLTPWLLESLLPQGTFLLFAVMCIPYILIIRFLVPETTGKTLEQIEQYWEEKA